MTDGSVLDVLGRARRDAARLEARRTELQAQRAAIDLELESVDADFARIGIVIEYCENGTADDSELEAPPAVFDEQPEAGHSIEGAAWGRQPDRNVHGLTRVEVARRMLEEGAPLAPRTIAEAFQGAAHASRAQVESMRKALRKLARSGFARVRPDGTYVIAGASNGTRQRPSPTADGASVVASGPSSASEVRTHHVGAPIPGQIPVLIPEQAAGHQPRTGGVNGFPFAVSASVLLQLLATAGRPMRALDLAQALGREPIEPQLESIRQTMRRCVTHGDAVLVERGLWAIAQTQTAGGRAGI